MMKHIALIITLLLTAACGNESPKSNTGQDHILKSHAEALDRTKEVGQMLQENLDASQQARDDIDR